MHTFPNSKDDPHTASGPYRVQVLEKVFEILEELGAEPDGLGPSEIAHRLPFHRSTIHRLLSVLEQANYVRKMEGTGRYQLGWKLIELGAQASRNIDLAHTATPFLNRLARGSGETAHLGILSENYVVSIANADGPRTLRTPATVGRRTPAHCSSLGKAILATWPPEELEAFILRYPLPVHTAHTIRTQERFRQELATVRKRGFAIDNEEYEEGLKCIGAPVRNFTGAAVAAISIAGPAGRMDNSRLPGLARLVVETARQFSATLGYRRDRRNMVEPEPPGVLPSLKGVPHA